MPGSEMYWAPQCIRLPHHLNHPEKVKSRPSGRKESPAFTSYVKHKNDVGTVGKTQKNQIKNHKGIKGGGDKVGS